MTEKVLNYAHKNRRHGFGFASIFTRVRHMFRRFVMRFIAPIARHPAMTLVTGFGLFLSGTVELADQMFTEFDTAIGIHQGVILLGVVTFLRGIADLVEASEWLSKGSSEGEEAAFR